jgi:hypothetical protein
MKRILHKTITAAGSAERASVAFRIFGFDRITVWLDRPELPISKDLLERHCTEICVHFVQMRYQARWKCRVVILQPTEQCLVLLAESLGQNIAARVTYVEIACDLPAASTRQALLWCDKFLASARPHYQRQPVVRYKTKTTYYYGRRTHNGKRRSHVQVVYCDSPSKLHNARPPEGSPPCLHIEWRATGSAALERLGIVSLQDLIRFNHERFWNKHIRLYELPKKTQLGRVLAELRDDGTNVSSTALRKRATRWIEKFTIGGNFVMHNAVRDSPGIKSHLTEKTFAEWLETTVSSP